MRKTLFSLFIILSLSCCDFEKTKSIETFKLKKQTYEMIEESYEIGYCEGALMIKYNQTKLEYGDIEILAKFNAKKFVNRIRSGK